MADYLNHIADAWWNWMFSMFWQVGLLIVLIAILDLLIRKWVWPQLRYALWLLVLVKLVLPPSLTAPTSLISGLQPLAQEAIETQWQDSPPADVADSTKYSPPMYVLENEPGADSIPMVVPMPRPVPMPLVVPENPGPTKTNSISSENVNLSAESTAGSAMNESDAEQAQSVTAKVKLHGKFYLMLVWAMGIWILTGWFILHWRQLTRQVRKPSTTDKLPDWFFDSIRETADLLGLRRIPKVAVSSKIATPAVFGVFRPTLLMPTANLDKLSRRDARHVLLHELAHIKRRDPLAHTFNLVLQIVYWYNPLLWLVRRQLQHLRELCCDATVAKVLRENTPAYRETLLEIAKRLLAKRVEPGLGLLGLFENSNRLVTRLKWLEKNTWKHSRIRFAAIVLVIVAVSVCILPMAQAEKDITPGDTVKPNVGNSKLQGKQQIENVLQKWFDSCIASDLNSLKTTYVTSYSLSQRDVRQMNELLDQAGNQKWQFGLLSILWDEAHAKAISRELPAGDPQTKGAMVLVWTLVKNKEDWKIDDIDLEEVRGLQLENSRFHKKYPNAKVWYERQDKIIIGENYSKSKDIQDKGILVYSGISAEDVQIKSKDKILIEAQFLRVPTTAISSLGSGQKTEKGEVTTLVISADQIDTLIQNLKSQPQAQVLSAPQLIAMAGETAEIFIGQELPDSKFAQGIRMRVLPTLDNENHIGLDIQLSQKATRSTGDAEYAIGFYDNQVTLQARLQSGHALFTYLPEDFLTRFHDAKNTAVSRILMILKAKIIKAKQKSFGTPVPTAKSSPLVQNALANTLVTIEFQEMPLSEVLKFLAKNYDLNLNILWGSLENDAGITQDDIVTLMLKQVSLQKVLESILANVSSGKQAPAKYMIDQGVITIATEEELQGRFQVQPMNPSAQAPRDSVPTRTTFQPSSSYQGDRPWKWYVLMEEIQTLQQKSIDLEAQIVQIMIQREQILKTKSKDHPDLKALVQKITLYQKQYTVTKKKYEETSMQMRDLEEKMMQSQQVSNQLRFLRQQQQQLEQRILDTRIEVESAGSVQEQKKAETLLQVLQKQQVILEGETQRQQEQLKVIRQQMN